MKRLISPLLFAAMALPSPAQIPAPPAVASAQAQSNGILQSVTNADLQPAGDHYLVTRRDGRQPVEINFKPSLGVGVNRERGQWWILPISAAGNRISVNTNLWVLPENPLSTEHSWYIKLPGAGSIDADLEDVLSVRVNASQFELYRSEARPHSDAFNHRYSLSFSGSETLENALAAFYWGTMLPSVVERTKAKNYPYSDGYVISTLNPKSYAGSYPDVDHEFQIKGRLAMATAADLDVVRRMIQLQFKLMNDDPEKLFRDPCSVQPSGLREYHVRRSSEDRRTNAEMFLLTGNMEVLEESWLYFEATKDTAWLRANIVNLENAASLTVANTDRYGRVWSDVYYEDQVMKDGRATQAQAFAAHTFSLLAGMENTLNRKSKSVYYAGLSKKIAAALVKPLPMGYWDETNQRFIDWVDRNGRPHDHIHLLSNELPVLFGYASGAQAHAVMRLLHANLALFERFPSFVAADIAAYDKSEIGSGGPYDLAAAGRYWYWDAAFWESRNDNGMLFDQLTAVAHEAAKSDYFMGERYDMDYVYYIDGKDWHGAEMYYEYPCVYAAVLIRDLLGLSAAADADVSVKPHLNGYGTVEFGIPIYGLKYTYGAKEFVLQNLSAQKRRFAVDLSALYAGKTSYRLQNGPETETVGAKSTIELAPRQQARWIPSK